MAVTIRRYDASRDRAAVRALDRSYTTSTVYDVSRDAHSITLVERELPTPLTRTPPIDDELDDDQPSWDVAWVAIPTSPGSSGLLGFAASSYQRWNRRMAVQHLYVDAAARRLGIASALIGHVGADASAHGAIHVWLETSNLNYPAIAAYRRMGFVLCGLDLCMFDGTESSGEVAVYMSRSLQR
jgi:ribosomal protein S18 acetylase RimI-like enzyme